MYTSYSSNSYSSTITEIDLLKVRLIVSAVVIVVELVGAAIIYGFIKCCCPTSLRRVRPGLILSGDNSCSTVQPIVVQNMIPIQTIREDAYQPMSPPPQYVDDAAVGEDGRQALMPK